MVKIRVFWRKNEEIKQQAIAVRETLFSGGMGLEGNVKLEDIYDPIGDDKAKFYNSFYTKNKELFINNPALYWMECSRQYAEQSNDGKKREADSRYRMAIYRKSIWGIFKRS